LRIAETAANMGGVGGWRGEWMTEVRLLDDVNLSEIEFESAGRNAVLTFLNMSDGAVVGTLRCQGLAFFKYSVGPGDCLPQYAGEVNCTKLADRDEAWNLLQSLGFGYRDFARDKIFGNGVCLQYVRVEGAFTLYIVCRDARFSKSSEKEDEGH
jgi:hypothetical protein